MRRQHQRLLLFLSAVVSVTLWTYACGDGTTEPPPDPPRPTTVTVSPATAELAALGATVQLSAQVQDQNGQVMSGATVTWASGAAAVATVDASGLVTAVANGTATITATAGSASGSATVTVAQVVSSVTVAPMEANFAALSDTLRLTAEAFDANGHTVAGAEFSWETSDGAVATVDASGLVTSVANGTVTITATAGEASGSATVTVAQVVSSVTAVPAEASFATLGDTLRLTAEGFDANGHTVADVEFSWETSDGAVATVDASGLVTSVANGTVTITATAGEASGSATVTVAQVVSSVTAVPAEASFATLGDTLRLTAEGFDANGHTVADVEFSWESSDNSVATVDASGLVTAVASGSATITATAGEASGSATVTVAQVVSSVTAVPAEASFAALGDTLRMTAAAVDANGHAVAGAEFSWETSATAVATVDATGLVTAAGNGTASITAASGAASGMASVVVAQEVSSLAVEPTGLTPPQAGKQGADTIMVTALDAEGSPVAGSSYRWSTDRQSGWVYPPAGTTDEMGRFQTTWVAGWPGEGTLSLTVENEFSRLTEELATLSTVPANPPNGAATIWINNPNHPSEGYSIDMTPLTEPTGTYYAAIQWDGGYTGLQRGGSHYDRQLQFSVWDAPGYGGAELIERASDVLCRTFGGEGTGVACALNYPWTVGSTYRFEVTEREMNGGSAMTLYVTDLAAGSRRYVGTIRFARRANMTRFGMFVEDFVQRADHCLAREVRSAAIRRPRARLGDEWVAVEDMTRGRLGRWLEDPWNPGTPGCANLAARGHTDVPCRSSAVDESASIRFARGWIALESSAWRRDPVTGRVRGFLRDVGDPAAEEAGALGSAVGLDLLFSRGIPDAAAWRR